MMRLGVMTTMLLKMKTKLNGKEMPQRMIHQMMMVFKEMMMIKSVMAMTLTS